MKKSVNDRKTKVRTTKNTFRSFAEYWYLTKRLKENHRRLLLESMSQSEQNSLRNSFEDGGWSYLFMRNACDEMLNQIQQSTGVDLLAIRVAVTKGHPQLIHKSFWLEVTKCFDGVSWEHVSYIFDGLKVEEFDEDYIKLVHHKPVQ